MRLCGVYECRARGSFRMKNIYPVAGDNVCIELGDEANGIITEIHERKNFILRPPLANLDQLIFISSTCEPSPSLFDFG